MHEAGTQNGRRRKSTIYDIASETNASPSTVSLVLNGSWSRYRIKEDTALRIQQSAKRLGYNVNLKARGLRLSRSGLAGMILPHYRNRFFAELVEAFEAEARKRQLCPIVVSTQRDPAVETRVTETLLAQRVEFLFIAGVPDPTPMNALCRAAEVPCVNLDLPADSAPSIVSNNADGAQRLTERVMSEVSARGGDPRDLVYLGGVAGEYASDNRVAGFKAAFSARGLSAGSRGVLPCGYPSEQSCRVFERHVALDGRLPAGIVVNSIAAFEGLVQFTARQPRTALGGMWVAAGHQRWKPNPWPCVFTLGRPGALAWMDHIERTPYAMKPATRKRFDEARAALQDPDRWPSEAAEKTVNRIIRVCWERGWIPEEKAA